MPAIKKKSLKEKFHLLLSEKLINFALKFPDWKIDSLEILKSFGYGRGNPVFTSEAIQKELKIKLHCLWMYELLPMEDLNIESIVEFCKGFSSKGRFLNTSHNLKESLEEFSSNGTTGNINCGILDFLKNSEKIKGRLIDHVYLKIDFYGSEFVGFKFCVFPNDDFYKKFEKIINSNHFEEVYLNPKLLFFKGKFHLAMNSKMSPGAQRKYLEVEQLINELKDEVSFYSRKFIKGLFFKEGFVIPTLEVWETNEKSLSKLADKIENDLLLLKLKRNYFGSYENKTGSIVVNFSYFGNDSDHSLKIILGNEPTSSDLFSGELDHFAGMVLPRWSLRTFLMDKIQVLNEIKKDLLKKKGRLFRKALFDIKREIIIESVICNRAIDVLKNVDLNKNYLSSFEENFQIGQHQSGNFYNNFSFNLALYKSRFMRIQKSLKEYSEDVTNLFSAESNYALQNKVAYMTWIVLGISILQLFNVASHAWVVSVLKKMADLLVYRFKF